MMARDFWVTSRLLPQCDHLIDAGRPHRGNDAEKDSMLGWAQGEIRTGIWSRPRHHLELRRAGGGQALPYAIDVRCRDVDAQQHSASRDLSLQGFGRFLW